jgi:hypothetical protein
MQQTQLLQVQGRFRQCFTSLACRCLPRARSNWLCCWGKQACSVPSAWPGVRQGWSDRALLHGCLPPVLVLAGLPVPHCLPHQMFVASRQPAQLGSAAVTQTTFADYHKGVCQYRTVNAGWNLKVGSSAAGYNF